MLDQQVKNWLRSMGCTAISFMENREVWKLQRRWRGLYSRELQAQTGKWVLGGRDWHVFSGNQAAHVSGGEAVEAFDRVASGELIVLVHNEITTGASCLRTNGFRWEPLPCVDSYVFPPDLHWTMCFTHEQGGSLELGPYFARLEWQPWGEDEGQSE